MSIHENEQEAVIECIKEIEKQHLKCGKLLKELYAMLDRNNQIVFKKEEAR